MQSVSRCNPQIIQDCSTKWLPWFTLFKSESNFRLVYQSTKCNQVVLHNTDKNINKSNQYAWQLLKKINTTFTPYIFHVIDVWQMLRLKVRSTYGFCTVSQRLAFCRWHLNAWMSAPRGDCWMLKVTFSAHKFSTVSHCNLILRLF